jgi:hypothetical protein
MAACLLLLLLIVGVGSVMAFVFGGATPAALVVGAVLVVMSFHGLRRIDPSQSDECPPDDWGTAIIVTVIMGAIVIGGLVWTPWVTVFGMIVFWRWVRLLDPVDRRTPHSYEPIVEAPTIVPPIVVAEDSDLSFFRSVNDVLSYLEPWFPSSCSYRAFDSQGRRLELFAEPPVVTRRVLGPIWTDNAHESSLHIRAIEEEPSGVDELTTMLRDWLARVDPSFQPAEDPSLEALLARATERGDVLAQRSSR